VALLSQEDQNFLRDHFAKSLQKDVTLAFFTQHDSKLSVPGQQCRYCKETGELLQEVAGLNEHIKVETFDFVTDAEKAKEFGVEMIPAVIIVGPESKGIKFYGIPSGYEFSTLIEDISEAGNGASNLSATTKEELKKITEDTHIQVFVTPT
jgi:glutaredoxin-like protein